MKLKINVGSTLRQGVFQIVDHPQLWLTIVVAFTIVASFVFVADRFIVIARDAQDRLVMCAWVPCKTLSRRWRVPSSMIRRGCASI